MLPARRQEPRNVIDLMLAVRIDLQGMRKAFGDGRPKTVEHRRALAAVFGADDQGQPVGFPAGAIFENLAATAELPSSIKKQCRPKGLIAAITCGNACSWL